MDSINQPQPAKVRVVDEWMHCIDGCLGKIKQQQQQQQQQHHQQRLIESRFNQKFAMKSFFKKAKQAYKSHFFLTQEGMAPPEDDEHANKIIDDINPIKEEGPQGFIAFCSDENNNNPPSGTTSAGASEQYSSHRKDTIDGSGKDAAKDSSSTNTSTTASTANTTTPSTTNNNAAATSSTTTTTTSTTPTKDRKQTKTKTSFFSFGGKKETASEKKAVNNSGSSNNNNNNNNQPLAAGANNNNNHQKTPPVREEEKVEREIIYIKGLEDLPEDCLKLIRISGLPEEKLRANLQVLLHVLHFRTGKIIKVEGELPKEPRKKVVSERFNDGETLIQHVEPPQLKKMYRDCDQVGKGGFGTVYFGRSTKEKKLVAIKKMPHLTKRQQVQNYREASILSKCDHPNIVKLITCHVDKDQNMWVVMEFMEGGTFEEAAKAWKFNENNLAYVARELLKGLSYLHEKQMVHRDLKSANIMMSVEGKVKLIDFGLCEDVASGPPCHMVGSPFWMAPEMILGKPHGTPVDIWSFAISLLEMANQRPPMMESAVKAMFTVATEGATGFDEPELWSDTFKDFLSLCLKIDPEERATAEQLLKHPFIKKADTRDNMENILKKIFLTNSLMNSEYSKESPMLGEPDNSFKQVIFFLPPSTQVVMTTTDLEDHHS
ncbi:putative protein serine/threonine kinase [Cavenderia fasciculata]|uniref:non-specific serine/threonine protein kinase n=1 Tax=Cavenderia fasciculata TaxID=261658 RepID=F4Q1P7_CACFS|nr:putative protein serine/threonine kinase [Cavenderia fasciculata]EGG18197.1 putative protein serine/threonine kinase [Cavenderia fasciculata]|eukprot:XP_004357020.1 putative protein serine/threonine kinase [Cavenderia fasciculata]